MFGFECNKYRTPCLVLVLENLGSNMEQHPRAHWQVLHQHFIYHMKLCINNALDVKFLFLIIFNYFNFLSISNMKHNCGVHHQIPTTPSRLAPTLMLLQLGSPTQQFYYKNFPSPYMPNICLVGQELHANFMICIRVCNTYIGPHLSHYKLYIKLKKIKASYTHSRRELNPLFLFFGFLSDLPNPWRKRIGQPKFGIGFQYNRN